MKSIRLFVPGMLLAFTGVCVAAERPNLLIITVDDMSADSLGCFGCPLEGTSPHIDQLAAGSLKFQYAHVQVGNCMPGRNVMWSGRMPHNNRVEGFYQVPDAEYPVLCDLMKAGGYFTAIRGKVNHSTPYTPYDWNLVLDTLPDGTKAHNKDAKSYGISTAHGINAATEAGKPFCVMVNVSDPHKPFYAQNNRTGATIDDPHVPSRAFTPEEVPVPGFLFDDPVVRKELSHYYSSVRRADDCVGEVLAALDASGHADDTFVMFLSDHGMALPFAKTQVYHHSTHTPLLVRWPGMTPPGSIDEAHMVSAVDFLPTLLDVSGLEHPAGMDGRSFAPLLHGESQDGRDYVIKEYNENSGASRDPMRAVQSRRFLYIFNPWSNGERIFATATTGTPTYRRMAQLAATDADLAARLDLYQHRVPEEFYDVAKDPDCLHNLIDDVDYQDDIEQLRSILADDMKRTHDPVFDVFENREDAAAREAYVRAVEKEAEARKARRKKNQNTARVAPASSAPNIILILTDDHGWSQLSKRMDPRVPESRSAYLKTPNMARLMTEGRRFTSGYSPAPLCTPTRRSILCGTSTARSGPEFKSPWVPADHLTIPRALKQVNADYRCAHFGKWGEQMISTPEQCGYDASDGMTGNITGGMPASLGVQGGHADGPPHFIDNDDPKRTNSITTRAIEFMTEQAQDKKPFYVQVSYYAQHLSVVTSEAMLAKWEQQGTPDRRYPPAWAAMMEELDYGVGRLLDAVDDLGIRDETYIFFTADNGGRGSVPGGDNSLAETNTPLTGAKHSLYEGGIRVPFFARGPGITPGSVCRTPVVGYDFLPTFHALAGGDSSGLTDEIDGVSLTPLLGAATEVNLKRPQQAVFFHRPDRGFSAIRQAGYKLMLFWHQNGTVKRHELYRVGRNPTEEDRDLASKQSERAAKLQQTLLSYLESVNAPMPKPRKKKGRPQSSSKTD